MVPFQMNTMLNLYHTINYLHKNVIEPIWSIIAQHLYYQFYKLLESVVKDKLIDYFSKFAVLGHVQFDFRFRSLVSPQPPRFAIEGD